MKRQNRLAQPKAGKVRQKYVANSYVGKSTMDAGVATKNSAGTFSDFTYVPQYMFDNQKKTQKTKTLPTRRNVPFRRVGEHDRYKWMPSEHQEQTKSYFKSRTITTSKSKRAKPSRPWSSGSPLTGARLFDPTHRPQAADFSRPATSASTTHLKARVSHPIPFKKNSRATSLRNGPIAQRNFEHVAGRYEEEIATRTGRQHDFGIYNGFRPKYDSKRDPWVREGKKKKCTIPAF